ncbi:MAG: hypothetical protein JSW16_01395 [Dehalococcoidales bacterium]|nr:MAG: hypothetical protein JSW16_01395 [Dehalococcoidales bacterium]
MVVSKKKVAYIGGREFEIVKDGLSQSQVDTFITKLMEQNQSLIRKTEQLAVLEKLAEQTIAEADKLAESIKSKAQEEAAYIVQMATTEAEEMIRDAREDSKQALVVSRERLESKLKEKANEIYLKILNRLEGTISEVWSADLIGEGVVTQSARPQIPAQYPANIIEEPVAERPLPGLYEGKVNLDIVPPVDLAKFMNFRKEIKNIPQLRILHVSSSQKRGGTISILLTEPTPLLDILNGITDVEDVVADKCSQTGTTAESQQIEPIPKISIVLAFDE